MLAIKRSAGVAPGVNLRNPLHALNEACKQEIQPGFENQGRCHQKSKTGVSVVPLKGLMSYKNFIKKALESHTLKLKSYIGDSNPSLPSP